MTLAYCPYISVDNKPKEMGGLKVHKIYGMLLKKAHDHSLPPKICLTLQDFWPSYVLADEILKKSFEFSFFQVVMVQETEYDDVIECKHSYSERCHTTYTTDYQPQQENI